MDVDLGITGKFGAVGEGDVGGQVSAVRMQLVI